MGLRLVPTSVTLSITLNGVIALILRHFTEFDRFGWRPITSSGWKSHAGTVVPECFKDDNATQWKSGKFDSRSLRNTWTDRHLNLHGWLRRGAIPYAKFHHDTTTPFRLPQICENAHQVTRLVFWFFCQPMPRPMHRFLRSVRQMTTFRARMCLLGVSKTKFHVLTQLFPPKRKFWANFRRDFEDFGSKKP